MNFGERLKTLRLAKKLSQKEIGDPCGVSIHTVGKWEKNERDPSTNHLKILSKLLNTSIDFLLSESDVSLSDIDQRIWELMNEELVIKWLKEKEVPFEGNSLAELTDVINMIKTIQQLMLK